MIFVRNYVEIMRHVCGCLHVEYHKSVGSMCHLPSYRHNAHKVYRPNAFLIEF